MGARGVVTSLITGALIAGGGFALGQEQATPVECKKAVELGSAYYRAQSDAERASIINELGHARIACMGDPPDTAK